MLNDVSQIEPGITVVISTYNQRDTVERAIRSVMEQRGVPDLRILVADDASTDGATDVIRRLVAGDPRITHIARERNLGTGPRGNSMTARRTVVTKYWAFLEGDDYWCDPDKLRLQYEALEAHPKCTFCAHQTSVIDAEGKTKGVMSLVEGVTESASYDFEHAPLSHPSSRLCRHPLLIGQGFYADFMAENTCLSTDISWQYAYLDRGPMWLINRVMSVYNYNGKGVFSSMPAAEQAFRGKVFLYQADLYTNFRHTAHLQPMYMPQPAEARCKSLSFPLGGWDLTLTLKRKRK